MGQYSSHPIARLKLGRFQFERGVLSLDATDETEFDKLLATQPVTIRGRVHKISVAGAERVAASFKQSRMYAGIDTTHNSVQAVDPAAPAHVLADELGLPHANLTQPGASKDKLTDGNSEPQSQFGTKHDMIDFVDGDEERRFERSNPVQVSLNAVGGTNGSDVAATGESVAIEESAKIAASPDSTKVGAVPAQEAPVTSKPLLFGKPADSQGLGEK